MLLLPIVTTSAIAFISILWVELIRDSYHLLSHYWQPLYRLHSWHHRVFRPNLTPISEEIYRKAHWYNDVPEAFVMLGFSLLCPLLGMIWQIPYHGVSWLGSIYTIGFLGTAIARGLGVPNIDELTDLTHLPGEFKQLPSKWMVNRPYHWRHHFDNQKAYYCGTFTFVDKIMGTALSLKGKTVAVTGASGTLGQALLRELCLNQAKVIALTSKDQEISLNIEGETKPIKTLTWQVGAEENLLSELEKIDILIINHGINVHEQRTSEAIEKSYQVNAFSVWRLMELFLKTIKTNKDKACKEIWINTSEAEISPAISPLYELSKRTIGDLITLRRLDSPCVIRKLILGPFKSNLNPIGVMSADWVAKQIISLAKRDFRDIIVTINPITYVVFPLKEWSKSLYFSWFTKSE
ncbi:MAG: bifunctional sterol desaturase/short chain dehydrogenase [Microcystaceae cyanobacterium]